MLTAPSCAVCARSPLHSLVPTHTPGCFPCSIVLKGGAAVPILRFSDFPKGRGMVLLKTFFALFALCSLVCDLGIKAFLPANLAYS